MAKTRSFSPDAAIQDAKDTIVAAEARKVKAQEKVDPIKARVERAKESLAAAEAKVTAEDAIIAQAQAFLDRMAGVSPEAIASTEGEPATV